MVMVKKHIRISTLKKRYAIKESTAIKSGIKTPKKCSWDCYFYIEYCKSITPFFLF